MSLEQRVRHLEEQYEAQQGVIDDILVTTRHTREMLVEHIKDTGRRFDEQGREIAELRSDVSVLKSDMSGLRSEFSDFRVEFEDLKEFIYRSLSQPR